MASEIEAVDEVESRDREAASTSMSLAEAEISSGVGNGGENDEPMKDDVHTAAAYGDMEKLHRLVESEGHSVSEPDGLGYSALQWAALNNRTAAAQYIIEVYYIPSHSFLLIPVIVFVFESFQCSEYLNLFLVILKWELKFWI